MTPKAMICTGSCSALIAALCCVTPLAVIALGAVGLGAVVPALDFILIPALLVSLVLAFMGWLRLQRGGPQADR